MKKIIVLVMLISSLFAGINELPEAKVISTTDCRGINLKVNFQTNSNVIEKGSLSQLQDFADYMNADKSKKAEIAGYTDSRGSDSYNLALSQRRAKAVYQQLITDGVDASRLTHVGYGEADPVASNKTTKGQRENRRIEAKLY